MRLWTLHPCYLDVRGLTAVWREGLLALKVLRGKTTGYRNHPQLTRFRNSAMPVAAITEYLWVVHEESLRRDYHFDKSKLGRRRDVARINETRGQLMYEWGHLLRKLEERDTAIWRQHRDLVRPKAHPLFKIVSGQVREWEKIK